MKKGGKRVRESGWVEGVGLDIVQVMLCGDENKGMRLISLKNT